MARKSRKQNKSINLSLELPMSCPEPKQKNLAGIYVRLSLEDNGYKHGVSLQNQILLLTNYIERHSDEIQLVGIYQDNGLTGTNFERDGWEQLIEDLKKKKINCIVVKDFSRIGRNYIEVGNYLEKIFPFLGVRVIAVNENFDSAKQPMQSDMLIHSLTNIVNEYYVRDISKKIRQVKRFKQEHGEYICATAPYGYKKSDSDKKKLKIDEESACVVKQIFLWRIQGKGCLTIANYLNELAIPSPGMYYYMNGNQRYKTCAQSKWKSKHVVKILTDLTYLGHTVQGKTRSCCFEQNGKIQVLPREDWIVVKHTHEPLVTQEVFAIAERMAKQNKEQRTEQMNRYCDIPHVDNPLRGKIFCGQCGGLLTRRSRVKNGVRKYSYFCGFSKQRWDAECSLTGFSENFLMNKIVERVKTELGQIENLSSSGAVGCQHTEKKNSEGKKDNDIEAQKLKPQYLKKPYLERQIAQITRKKQELYIEFKEKKILLEKYLEKKKELVDQQQKYWQWMEEADRLGSQGENENTGNTEKKEQIIVEKSEEFPLSMLEQIIDKVVVFSREKIEIVYVNLNHI